LAVIEGRPVSLPSATWILLGVVSHERYVQRREHEELAARSPGLRRPEATNAALIPIRKSEAWWSLPQDQRRAIFEEQSRHIATGLQYLPDVARPLHHSRDLGEPFDFLTWFEFAPANEGEFGARWPPSRSASPRHDSWRSAVVLAVEFVGTRHQGSTAERRSSATPIG
jgi:hypothetical protein